MCGLKPCAGSSHSTHPDCRCRCRPSCPHPLNPNPQKQAVGRLYHQPTLASSVTHLQDNIEDLFDACAAPYFPVIFNAPKHNPHAITRDMLLQRVLAAMAACPEFAPLAIPVLSEKLGSSLR